MENNIDNGQFPRDFFLKKKYIMFKNEYLNNTRNKNGT